MNIRHLAPLLLLVSTLQSMEVQQIALKGADEDTLEVLNPIPDYLYFYSAWSWLLGIKGLPLGALSTPSLHTAAQQIEATKHKKEFINMCSTLLIMEAALLRKPFEEFTVEDIQKINALLLYGIQNRSTDPEASAEERNALGALRPGRIWIELPRATAAHVNPQKNPLLRSVMNKIDLHHEDALEIREFLTKEEYEAYKTIFLETPPAPWVAGKLEEMLTQAKTLYRFCQSKQQDKELNGSSVLAAHLHKGVTGIYIPFVTQMAEPQEFWPTVSL